MVVASSRAGAFVGFFSGLLGMAAVRDGAVLAFVFAAKGFPPDHVVHLALGTVIATMLFTSVGSVRSHHLRESVQWGVLRAMAPGLVIGTLGVRSSHGRLDVRLLSSRSRC